MLEEEATVSGDPDLDLIDAAFDDAADTPSSARPGRAPSSARARLEAAPSAAPAGPEAGAPAPRAPIPAEDDFSGLTAEEGPTVVQFSDPTSGDGHGGGGGPRGRGRARAVARRGGRDRGCAGQGLRRRGAGGAATDGEPRAGGSGRSEGDELLRLRSELHAAEQLVEDLRDQHAQAEQRELELKAELSRKD